jgi:cytosine/adenosine deaminase-related metal-dependent hydrolase
MTQSVSGTLIWGDEFEVTRGTLYIEEGIIVDMIEEPVSQDVIIAPCFVNAHTHIGDSVLKDPLLTNLDELVRPPDGLKHRILNSTPMRELVGAMRSTLMDMKKTGTSAFIDFREGGAEGVTALKDALAKVGGLRCRIMGRPSNGVSEVLSVSDGIGVSGVNDMDWSVLVDLREAVRKSGKSFAIHAGEKDASDLDPTFELEPDFLVHLTHGSKKDFMQAVEQDCGVVVCPRSNFLTGVGMPDIRGMLECGVLVGVGTDNVMLNSVNMFAEIEFISKIFLHDDRQVFKLCTLNGAKISGIAGELGSIELGKKAHLMLLNKNSWNLRGIRDPLAGLVRRARPDDIIQIIGAEHNGK